MYTSLYGLPRSHSASAQPTLQNLQLIRWMNKNGELKKFQLQPLIRIKWIQIGDLVNIHYDLLASWSREYHGDPLKCIRAVLSRWLCNPTEDYPATWDGLYELLADIDHEYREITHQLKQCLGDASTTQC